MTTLRNDKQMVCRVAPANLGFLKIMNCSHILLKTILALKGNAYQVTNTNKANPNKKILV